MKNLSSVQFLLTLWCLNFLACKEIPLDLEEKAASHYIQKQYSEALRIWYGMIDEGHCSASVYYNIGVAESHLNNIPASVFALEMALRIQPLSNDIRQALTEERKKIENGAIPVNPFFLQQGYQGMLSVFRPGFWALSGLCLLLIVTASNLSYLKRKPLISFTNRKLIWIAASLGILLLIISGLAYKQLYQEDEAIVIAACAFMEAPSNESPQRSLLQPGEKVIIKDQIGDWINIDLVNLEAGWIKKDCLKPILMCTK